MAFGFSEVRPGVRREFTQFMVERVQLASQMANLVYKLPACCRSIEINGNEWRVIALKRSSGIEIAGTSAMSFQREPTSVCIAVPGTETLNDWFSNLCTTQIPLRHSAEFLDNLDPGLTAENFDFPIHAGFLSVADSIIRSLVQTGVLRDCREITITGHSQGGAVASILSLYAATHKALLGIPPESKLKCITFASPRAFTKPGFSFFMQHVPHTYRIFNPLDIVPKTPLGFLGFKHVGLEIQLTSSLLTDAISDVVVRDLRDSMNYDLEATCRVTTSTLSLLSPRTWLARAATPHSMEHYESIINCPAGQELLARTIDRFVPGLFHLTTARYVPNADDNEDGISEFTVPNLDLS